MGSKLWSDCHGGIITTELVLVSSVVVGGLLTGLTALRSSVTQEFKDLSQTVREFDREQPSQVIANQELEQQTPDVYLPEEFIQRR
ncbi:MAG: hypothetical protein AB8B55_23855 [Mariniblastus sp.]